MQCLFNARLLMKNFIQHIFSGNLLKDQSIGKSPPLMLQGPDCHILITITNVRLIYNRSIVTNEMLIAKD